MDADEEEVLVIRYVLNIISMREDEWFCNNIFYIRCILYGMICDVIIDSGSCKNVVVLIMVEKLELLTEDYFLFYKFIWLKKGNCYRFFSFREIYFFSLIFKFVFFLN